MLVRIARPSAGSSKRGIVESIRPRDSRINPAANSKALVVAAQTDAGTRAELRAIDIMLISLPSAPPNGGNRSESSRKMVLCGYGKWHRLGKPGPPPEAVVICDHLIALGAAKLEHEIGRKAPGVALDLLVQPEASLRTRKPRPLVEHRPILLVSRVVRVGGARQHFAEHRQWQRHDEL